jgi:hypothetical protein
MQRRTGQTHTSLCITHRKRYAQLDTYKHVCVYIYIYKLSHACRDELVRQTVNVVHIGRDAGN